MRARWLLTVVLLGVASCVQTPDPGLGRARAIIAQLAGTIGSRPIGSAAADRARQYIESELTASGFAVRTQDATAVNAANGASAQVANVIAIHDGADREAIALVSHYDSLPDGPGAQDDALGVATCLEAGRQLLAAGLRHSLMVIVTDGEEVGLMGARAARLDPTLSDRVRAFLNFDGTGGTGPPVLFEAGPGRPAALDAWARAAVAPFGASFGVEIYKHLPNDTDFTILKGMNASGLNFAPVGDSYVYHTDRDRPGGVSDDTISREVSNTVAVVRSLDAASLERVDDTPTFFDIAERRAVVYSSIVTRIVGWTSVVLAVVAWLLVGRTAVTTRGFGALIGASVRAVLATGAAIAAMVAAAALLRWIRQQPAPWYASPVWAFGAFAAVGAMVVSLPGRLRAPTSAGASRSIRPLLVWWTALPAWAALTTAFLLVAPAASYLGAIPLLAVAVLLLVSRSLVWARLASACAFVVVAVLWTTNIATLLGFLVPLFGWLPLVTPVWIYPAVLGLAGLMLLPPWIAVWADSAIGRRAAPITSALCAVAIVVLGVGATIVPSYTEDRPARRFVRYVQDDARRQAWWDVGGSDAFTMPPGGGAWNDGHAPIVASATLAALASPIAVRSSVAPVVLTPPAAVHARATTEPGGRTLFVITITKRGIVTGRVILPRGVAPVASSLAGVMDRGQWMATDIAMPAGDTNITLTFDSVQIAALQGTIVLISVPGVPEDSGAMPSWLPGGPATWQKRSVFILPASPEGS